MRIHWMYHLSQGMLSTLRLDALWVCCGYAHKCCLIVSLYALTGMPRAMQLL